MTRSFFRAITQSPGGLTISRWNLKNFLTNEGEAMSDQQEQDVSARVSITYRRVLGDAKTQDLQRELAEQKEVSFLMAAMSSVEAAARAADVNLTEDHFTLRQPGNRNDGGLVQSVTDVIVAAGGFAGMGAFLRGCIPLAREWLKSPSGRKPSISVSVKGIKIEVQSTQDLEAAVEAVAKLAPWEKSATMTDVAEGEAASPAKKPPAKRAPAKTVKKAKRATSRKNED